MTEDRQVPDVLSLLAARIGVAGQGGQQRPGRPPGPDRGRGAVRDRCRLPPPQRVADPAQVHVGDLRPAAGALPDPEQHLHHDQRRQPAQAHLAPFGDRVIGQLPSGLVPAGLGPGDGPPPLIVGIAQTACAVGGTGAGRHRARLERGERPDPGISQELFHRRRAHPAAELAGMRLAHNRLRHRGNGQASRHRARGRARRQPGQELRLDDLAGTEPLPCQPGAAAETHAGQGLGGRGASIDPAHRPAQQPVPGRQRQHPAARVPSRFSQERRIDLICQPGGPPVEHDPGQDDSKLPAGAGIMAPAACPGRLRSGELERGTGHDVTPACSRGLGTASTAARNRAGSGCR